MTRLLPTLLLLAAAACASSQREVQRQQLLDQVATMHGRLARLEARVTDLAHDVTVCQAVAGPPEAPSEVFKTPPLDPAQQLGSALQDYQNGSTARAYKAFAAWLRTHPDHPAADSARFWMGQCKFDLGEYAAAADHFGQVPDSYPASQKAPDALLKLGLSYEHLHQRDHAATAFARLIARYPRSASAELARARLRSEDDHGRQ